MLVTVSFSSVLWQQHKTVYLLSNLNSLNSLSSLSNNILDYLVHDPETFWNKVLSVTAITR